MDFAQLWLIVPLLAAAAIAAAVRVGAREKLRCRALQLQGLRAVKQVKQLLVDLQMHRGMVNAYLNGDQAFHRRMLDKQRQIDSDVAALDALLALDFMPAQRWQEIKGGWQRVRQEAAAMSLEQSFHRHSQLIRAVLYLMGDIADRSRIATDCPAGNALVSALWSHLPSTAEGLGQARGLGAGVAARGSCSSVTRIKLRFLQERIAETMARVDRDLAANEVNGTLGTAGAQSWAATNQAVSQFLVLLENELINNAAPSIAADHYFEESTRALEAVFAVLDQASEALEQMICAGTRPPQPA